MTVAPPLDMHAPSGAYTVFYVLFVANLAGSGGWMLWRARSTRSVLPLAALGGGLAIGVVLPPIYNALTLVWFPSNIPAPFLTAFGMKDPFFDLVGYALFIGFGGWVLCEQLRAGRGRGAIWLTFAAWGVADLLFEVPFLQWGMYTYYGDQPFTIGGFPVHWVFMNGTVPVLAGVLMYVAIEHWPFAPGGVAWRVAAAPAVAGGLLLIPMAPVATALHADVASWVRWAAALVSIAISVATLRWIVAQFPASAAPVPDSRPTPPAAEARVLTPTT
jgi:hypothetical protein